MSDPIAIVQDKINLAMKLLLEAQQILDSHTDPLQASSAEIKPIPQKESPSISKIEAITALFAATLIDYADEEALTERLKSVMHSSVATNQHALASLIRFNWNRFNAQKHHYLQDPSQPSSFVVLREQPIPNQPTTTLKIFLDAPNRNPTPCTLQQEADGNWKILTFSL